MAKPRKSTAGDTAVLDDDDMLGNLPDPEMDQVESDEADSNGESNKGNRAPRPTYGLEVVDAIPESDTKRGGGAGRPSPYTALLTQVRDDEAYHNKHIKIAEFHTRGGAGVAARELRKRAAEGQFGEGTWAFDSSRIEQTSQLFVTFTTGE